MYSLGVDMRGAPTLLHALLEEGLLRSRVMKGTKLYSLNPNYPGIAHLEKLLRYLTTRTPEIRDLINYVLIRRHEIYRNGQEKQRGIIDAMKTSDYKQTPWGVRSDIGEHARQLLERGDGDLPVWHGKRA